MPTYEYACTECGDRTEVVQSISDPPPPSTPCAVCGGTVRKVFSPVGIVFKGSGFYRTDSRGKPAKTDGDKAKTPADPTPASTAKSSEGKSDGKSSTPKAAEKSA
ncbi:MAG TPA: FmdB family zinc ribbon protein [Actinomycetota bacterium]|jgi:putative FmdB family regulatory protein|nr:FmdB family zinc ribbon protein [Actinomycetota bacterium]